MTESRKLRRIKGVQEYRRHEELLRRGYIESINEEADMWMSADEARIQKLRKLGVVDMLGPLPKLPKLKPNEWRIPFRPQLFVQPMVLFYGHMSRPIVQVEKTFRVEYK